MSDRSEADCVSNDLVERVARVIRDASELSTKRDFFQDCARAAIAVVLEEAAKVCDGIESETWRLWKTHYDMLDQGRSDGAGDCAAAIRALVKEPTDPASGFGS